VQLERHALKQDAEALADQAMSRVAQFERRVDADRAAVRQQAAGDSPQNGECEAAQSVPL
jgi:phage shock protein A